MPDTRWKRKTASVTIDVTPDRHFYQRDFSADDTPDGEKNWTVNIWRRDIDSEEFFINFLHSSQMTVWLGCVHLRKCF